MLLALPSPECLNLFWIYWYSLPEPGHSSVCQAATLPVWVHRLARRRRAFFRFTFLTTTAFERRRNLQPQLYHHDYSGTMSNHTTRAPMVGLELATNAIQLKLPTWTKYTLDLYRSYLARTADQARARPGPAVATEFRIQSWVDGQGSKIVVGLPAGPFVSFSRNISWWKRW